MSVKTIAIIAGVVIVVLVGVVFWAAGQADSRKPAQTEITVPATNIGPNAPVPGAAENAPAQ